MKAYLQAEHLQKQFENVSAVSDVSFSVDRGMIFGLLGPNGAGKTTTIRMILGILLPDSGKILIDGAEFTDRHRNRIGYLPEERGLYRKTMVLETIEYFAVLRGLPHHEARTKAEQWLKRLDLWEARYRKLEELSKGNQQKVQFIISVVHEPDLLVLDEPFAGLDPVNQALLTEVLLDLRQRGTAIVLSTHQMEQAEKLADPILLIDHGKAVLHGQLGEIKRRYGTDTIVLEFDGDGSFLSSSPQIRKIHLYENYAELQLVDHVAPQEFLREVAGQLSIRKFQIVEPSLHAIFLDVVGQQEEHPS